MYKPTSIFCPVYDANKPHGLKGRKKSLSHRLKISQSQSGRKLSEETKEKIRQSMLRRRKEKEEMKSSEDITIKIEANKPSMDYFVMEKALLELVQLRREVSIWLQKWYAENDRKPSLEEVGQLSPEVHNKFLRYIALQEFIRSNN